MRSIDITSQALSSGIAGKALKHYNKAMPWGAKTRNTEDYAYSICMTSQHQCDIWMKTADRKREAVMYFSFHEKIGALTSSEGDRTLITMLNAQEIECICEARLLLLQLHIHRES